MTMHFSASLIAIAFKSCVTGRRMNQFTRFTRGQWIARSINRHGRIDISSGREVPTFQPTIPAAKQQRHLGGFGSTRPDFGGRSTLKVLMRPRMVVLGTELDQLRDQIRLVA
jgi:hypothetical protein